MQEVTHNDMGEHVISDNIHHFAEFLNDSESSGEENTFQLVI